MAPQPDLCLTIIENPPSTDDGPADDGPEIVSLYNELNLKGPVLIHLQPDTPYFATVRQGGKQLSTLRFASEQIVLITSDNDVQFQPERGLEPSFAVGWEKLATEVKIAALTHIVKFDGPVDYFAFSDAFKKYLQPMLRSTPQIAVLSREIFYSNLQLELFSGFCINYPPRSVNRFFKKLTVKTDGRDRAWINIRRLALGKYGFASLISIRLLVDLRPWQNQTRYGVDSWYRNPASIIPGGLRFRCQGSLDFTYQEGNLHPGRVLGPYDIQRIINDLQKNIVFDWKG